MAIRRDVTVGFRGANNKIERVIVSIPADWVRGDKDAMLELKDNPRLRTKLSVAPNEALWVEIGEPYDEDNIGRVVSDYDPFA